ncbi:hypothetical protein IV203_012660 [Nitzschia inconspicua]|uniref:Uncharacterized protein n=1 Tax=Nitzschia inconspicua TaxID=303405 RepID=A0A9K3KU98_9STRA|nr:hypothetical protein IV203_012660 [Nitzschia inconspicua]
MIVEAAPFSGLITGGLRIQVGHIAIVIFGHLVDPGVVLLKDYPPPLSISGLLGETYFQKSLVRFIHKLLTGTWHDGWLPIQSISLEIDVEQLAVEVFMEPLILCTFFVPGRMTFIQVLIPPLVVGAAAL